MDLPLLLSEFGDFTLFSQFDRYKTNFSDVNSSQIFITFKDDQNLIVKQRIKDLNMQKKYLWTSITQFDVCDALGSVLPSPGPFCEDESFLF